MNAIPNLERVHENNLLWPPIAQAVLTFTNRRSSGAASYERTWRLIHVWEAIAVTLSAAAISRVRSVGEHRDSFRRAREHLYGRTWDWSSRSFTRSASALDGNAGRRLDILFEFSAVRDSEVRFFRALTAFLTAESIDLVPLASAWARICEVPPDVRRKSPFAVRDAMRHVNTFRNRLAHVPFPPDGMDSIADALEQTTEQLFGIEPLASQHFPKELDRLESCLTGAVLTRDRRLRGSLIVRSDGQAREGTWLTWPALPKNSGGASAAQDWDAGPFIHCDDLNRPFVLTRLRSGANGAWELTRFLAEANSVITVESLGWLDFIPAPTEDEYVTEADRAEDIEVKSAATVDAPTPVSSAVTDSVDFAEALRLIRNENYEPAIAFFRELVESRPDYHIGFLRLGHAEREYAMRLRPSDRAKAHELFDDSIRNLERATEHKDEPRSAQAKYELSKSLYQRGRFLDAAADISMALSTAREAFAISADTSFASWIAYLESRTQFSSG